MDFSVEDKASSIKFFTEVYQCAEQGISNFGELCSPKNPKIGRIGERAGQAHPHVTIIVEMCRRKRHARDAPFVKSRGVWT